MSGHWPPEWDDPDEEFSGPAGQLDAAAEAQLSEVAAYLAAVPVPALPDAVESRISAALAAEDAVRPRLPTPLPRPAPARGRRRRPPASDHRRQGDGRRRGDFLRRPAVNVSLLVVCLGLAGVGFALAQGGGQEAFSSSVAAGSAEAPSPSAAYAAGSSAAGSSAVGSGGISASSANSASRAAVEPGAQASSASAPDFGSATFSVTASGTKYEPATLAEQVRARVAGSPASLGTATSGAALRGCVLHLTGGAAPRLVDRATYQGEPAYVIASSTRVWVVGLGCTAAKTELVVSVALAGLPGNLRALVSVEQ
jgi:hypothetical protein